jgi:hypothetical protein
MAIAYLDPNGDIGTPQWTGDGVNPNYTLIDDAVRQPTAPDSDATLAESLSVDTYAMTSATVGEVTSIRVWVYVASVGLGEAKVNINAGGWQTQQTLVNDAGISDWYSVEFTGSWGQSDLDALEVELTGERQTGGGVQVYAMYAEVTYTVGGVSELLGGHIHLHASGTGVLRRRRRLMGEGLATLDVSVDARRSGVADDSPYAENLLLQHLFGLASWAPPNGWLTLSAHRPQASDTGSTLVEPGLVDGTYGRLATSAASWLVDEQGLVTAASPLVFGPASEDWPEMKYLVLVTAQTGGQILKYRKLPSPITLGSGDSITLAADDTTRFAYREGVFVSHAWRTLLNQFIFQGVTPYPMGQLSVGLLLAAPSPGLRGIELLEPVDPAYTRQTVGRGSAHWAMDSSLITNVQALSFPTATTDSLATHCVVTTTSYAGVVGIWNRLAVPIAITTGQQATLSAGTIRLMLR